MTKSAKYSLLGMCVILAVLIALAPRLLTSNGSDGAQHNSGDTGVDKQIAARPPCPSHVVAGVELPCLGAESGHEQKPVTIVNVWAWWCAPCRDELPVLDDFAQQHPEFTVVGVHADSNAANGAALLNELAISLPSYQDDSNAFAAKLGLPAVVPITVVLTEENNVAAIFPKAFSNVEELNSAVQEALS